MEVTALRPDTRPMGVGVGLLPSAPEGCAQGVTAVDSHSKESIPVAV